MTIEQRDSGSKGTFLALEGEVLAGTLTYSWQGQDILVILHTEVDPTFGGKGVGKQLVMAAVDLARKDGLKIKLLCPFAKLVIGRDPGLQDLLHR